MEQQQQEAQFVTPKRHDAPESSFVHHVDSSKTKTRKRKRLSVQPNFCTLQEAIKIQSTVHHQTPSFLKSMQQSHVSSSFWMGVPGYFSRSYLPKHDTIMTLVDEDGHEYSIKYLAEYTAFSGGWRAFSIQHNLAVGDVLLFHLIESTKFKVYITRAVLPEDGALVPSDVFTHAEQVLGLLDIDASTCIKYHELCCSQNALLHEHLIKDFNSSLVEGIIIETVKLSDSIQASNLNTSKDEFTKWSKMLMAFECMGMNVGFLLCRLKRLESKAFESELAEDSNRFENEEIHTMEAKLVALKENSRMLEAEAATLKVKAKELERKFEAEVSAVPW